MSSALIAMLVVFGLTSIMGFPVGLALFGAGVLYFIVSGQDTSYAGEFVLHGLLSSFVLLAVPLFLFAARVMNEGGITDRLLNFASALVGRYRGGLAHVNISTSLIFAAMSGSATADAAGVGSILIRMMRQTGAYSPGFAAAVTAASATIGPVFPPSILMVFYAVASSTSVGALFMAGVFPGLMMMVILMLCVAFLAWRRQYPTMPRPAAAAVFGIVLRALLPLMMPVILLGGIYSGAFTPTEAAAVACLYALILCGLVYRTLGPARVLVLAVDTARTTSVIAAIFFGAFIFSYVLSVERIPAKLAAAFVAAELSPIMFLLIVNVVLLLLGGFLDATAIVLIIVPLLMPTVRLLGIDPVHFGVIVTLNVSIGLATPPFGMILFVVSSVNRIPLREILAEIWPLIGALLVALALITFVPEISLALPRAFGFVR